MSAAATSRLAVLGGGFAGVMLCVQLARRFRGPGRLRIDLIDDTGRFGAGPAYGTRCEKHLLNVPAGRMSALPDEPDHFLKWARSRDHSITAESFARRSLYGEYVGWMFEKALRGAPPSVQVERVIGRAIDINPSVSPLRITLDGCLFLEADHAVLALGNAAPGAAKFVDSKTAASSSFIGNPWRTGALSDVPRCDDVLIVGTGLTAVDVVLELEGQGHTGTIHAISRRGLLPQVHRANSVNVMGVSPEGMQHKSTGATPQTRTVRGILREVRAAARRLSAAGEDWRGAVDGMRSVTPAIWAGMSETEKGRFLRHLRAFWDTHRHRMAPEIESAIRLLRERGKLKILRGRALRCDSIEGGVRVWIRSRGMSEEWALDVGRIIHCTGPGHGLADTSNPLLRSLAERGVVSSDSLGLGMRTAASGELVGKDGEISNRISAIGCMRLAELWETTAVPEIRVQAANLAARLVERLPAVAQDRPASIEGVHC